MSGYVTEKAAALKLESKWYHGSIIKLQQSKKQCSPERERCGLDAMNFVDLLELSDVQKVPDKLLGTVEITWASKNIFGAITAWCLRLCH